MNKWNNPLRLLAALFAISILAAACGIDETPTATTDAPETSMATNDDGPDSSMDMGDDDDGGEAHLNDDVLEVAIGAPIPEVVLGLVETNTAGLFDMTVGLKNFTITEDAADGDPVENEGHMHVLVDGVKVERFFDTEHQVQVPNGEHLVEVEINANNHKAWAVGGEAIRAGQTVNVTGADEDGEAAADVTIEVVVADGEVEVTGGDRIDVPIDSLVELILTTDVSEEVHVHGYDLKLGVAAGKTASTTFTTGVAGRFEIELEGSGMFITELVVS